MKPRMIFRADCLLTAHYLEHQYAIDLGYGIRGFADDPYGIKGLAETNGHAICEMGALPTNKRSRLPGEAICTLMKMIKGEV